MRSGVNPVLGAVLGIVAIALIPASVENAQQSYGRAAEAGQPQKLAPSLKARTVYAHSSNNPRKPYDDKLDATSPVWTNWIQALSALAVAVFTVFLWRLQATQVGLTAKSAEAASKSARVAEQTLTVTQRAYVGVETIDTNPWHTRGGDHVGWAASVRYKNSGHTVANEVESIVRHDVLTKEEAAAFSFPFPADGELPPRPISMIAGNQGHASPRTFSFAELERVRAGEAEILLWGKITYRDLFEPDIPRTTLYAFKLTIVRNLFDTTAVPIQYESWPANNSAD